MLLSNAVAEKLLGEVRQSPLEKDEVRRIVGMGERYFANVETEVAPEDLFLFAVKISRDAS
jgi:hypothetical protein